MPLELGGGGDLEASPEPSHRHLSERTGKRHRAQRHRDERVATQDDGRASASGVRAMPPRLGRTMCRRVESKLARSWG